MESALARTIKNYPKFFGLGGSSSVLVNPDSLYSFSFLGGLTEMSGLASGKYAFIKKASTGFRQCSSVVNFCDKIILAIGGQKRLGAVKKSVKVFNIKQN